MINNFTGRALRKIVEIRYSTDGKAVANSTIAVQRQFKNKRETMKRISRLS